MNKFVVMADKEVGKTTLVNKILNQRKTNICGFFTKRYIDLANDEGQYPIYMCEVNSDPILDDKHLVGMCGNGRHYTNDDVFNELGVKLITTNNINDLIIMDEIGFLEMNADEFKKKVIEVLSSKNPVLLMLKQRLDIEFLTNIKENENVEFIRMNKDNRDEIYEYLASKLI